MLSTSPNTSPETQNAPHPQNGYSASERWSGRRDTHPQPSAWKAAAEPQPDTTTYDTPRQEANANGRSTPISDSPRPETTPNISPGFDLLHDIVGNGHRASRYARMNPPGSDAKYITVDQPLTDAQLDAHLRGEETYAAYIIGSEKDAEGRPAGLVSGACVELDQDSIAGAGRVLGAAEKRGVTAFSQAVKGAGNHDGSHTWILFDQRVTPADAARLARQIATEAGYPDAEIWPNGAAIRLPFGIHTHTQKRGRLILQSGETYDLDDADQFSMGAACAAALPKNPAPPEPPKVERILHRMQDTLRLASRNGPSPIAQFNAAHKPEDLIEQYGGRRTRDGWTCNCGVQHSHTTQLQVLSGGGIVSYSPDCRWAPHYTSGKVQDAFGLYCLVEHGGRVKDAVKALLPAPEPRVSKITFAEQPPKASIDQATAYNAARREKRHAENRQALEALAESVKLIDFTSVVPRGINPNAHDERAHLLLAYLLGLAMDAGVLQVRPTNAQLVEALDMCERYVIYAFRELEAAQIGKRHGGRGGLDRPNEAATFTFYRPPSLGCKAHQDAECTLVIDIRDLSIEPGLASEGGGVPLSEPDSPDTWAWCEDAHGADELNALEGASDNGEMDRIGATDQPAGSRTFVQPAPAKPRVVPSCGQWKVIDGECYTWHTTREAAEQAAGLAPASPCNLQGESPAESVEPDAPGASYEPDAPLPPPDPRAVPSWLRVPGDIAMERGADDQAEQGEQADLFEPAAPRLPFIHPARAAQILDMPPALKGWRPKHAAQARKARDALAALRDAPRSQAKTDSDSFRSLGTLDQPASGAIRASEPRGSDAAGLIERLRERSVGQRQEA